MSEAENKRTGQSTWLTSEKINTVIVAFTDVYGRLMGKRMTYNFFMNHIADSGMHVCNYLLAADAEIGPR